MKVKYLIFSAAVVISILNSSCVLDEFFPEKRYPNNLLLPNYGRLVYTGTLFDGKDIANTLIDGDIIWSFESFYGMIFRYDSNTKKIIKYDIEKKDKDGNGIYKVNPHGFSRTNKRYMVINNDSLLIPFVEKFGDNRYYIIKIDWNNMAVAYDKMPKEFDVTASYGSGSLHSYFFYDDKMYFRIYDDGSTIPYLTTDFENYNIIAEEEYSLIENIVCGYYIDSKGRLYEPDFYFEDSEPTTYLRVSIDNGITWFTNDMGSNFPEAITSADDTVYVSCEKYHEVFSLLQTFRVGGGLHIFKWEYN